MDFSKYKDTRFDEKSANGMNIFALRSISQIVELMRQSLSLDLVELWKRDGDEYECVFIMNPDDGVEASFDVSSRILYHPVSTAGRSHKYSPSICDHARSSPNGHFWSSVDSAPFGTDIANTLEGRPEQYKSALGFTFILPFPEHKSEHGRMRSPQKLFIIGFSRSSVSFTPTKFYFMSGMYYALAALYRDFSIDDLPCAEAKSDGAFQSDTNREDSILSNISLSAIQSADLNSKPCSFMQRGLTATHDTMQLIASTLDLDVVQLWKADPDGSDHVCVYVYVADRTIEWDPDVTFTYNYYPSDGRQDKKSIKMCQLSKESDRRVYWHVHQMDDTREMSQNYRTQMAYHLNCSDRENTEPSDIFMVGLSRTAVLEDSTALDVFIGLSYSVYVAAHDVVHPESHRAVSVLTSSKFSPLIPSQAELISRPTSLDRDDPQTKAFLNKQLGLTSKGRIACASDILKPVAEASDDIATFLYPIANIPAASLAINIDEVKNMKFLANGCNSNVYSGTLNNEKVAVKFIREDRIHDNLALREFSAELELLSRTNHANVVKLRGCGSIPRTFLVYEYMHGGILSSILLPNKMRPNAIKMFHKNTFSFPRVIQRALEFAEAMKYLHFDVYDDATIIHRDLKPDNIGFSGDGVLKIIDFGLAICVKRRQHITEAYDMSGNTGSLRYMAPEVAKNEPYTEKVDIYSFGLIVWQMATDQVPFSGLRTADFMKTVVTNNERPKVDQKIWPASFCSLLESCWDSDFTQRPTFVDVLSILEEIQAHKNDVGQTDSSGEASSPSFSQMLKRAGSFF